MRHIVDQEIHGDRQYRLYAGPDDTSPWLWKDVLETTQVYGLQHGKEDDQVVFCWGHYAPNEPQHATLRLVLFDPYMRHEGQASVLERLSVLLDYLRGPTGEVQNIQVTWFEFPEAVYGLSDNEKVHYMCQVISAVAYQDTPGLSGFPTEVVNCELPIPSQQPGWELLGSPLHLLVARQRILNLMTQLRDASLPIEARIEPSSHISEPVFIHR